MKIIAHRGASHDAPENTLAAVNLAWQQNADAVEIDVHLSKDGKLVVIHDATTKRTCGVNHKVREVTLAQLRTLDAGKWKGDQWAGEKIPTLEEVLAAVPRGKGVVVEIKSGPELLPELKRSLKRAALQPEQVFLAGFSFSHMKQAKLAIPDVRAYWIVAASRGPRGRPAWPVSAAQLIHETKQAGLDGLDVDARGPITPGFVRQVHADNLQLYVWTVDSAAHARKFKEAGVEGLTTNRPGWLRETLGRG